MRKGEVVRERLVNVKSKIPLFDYLAKSPFLLTFMKRIRKDKLGMFSLIIILITLFFAAFAEYIAPFPFYAQNLSQILIPPGNLPYLFGTDHLGRDIFSRIIYGTRILLYEITLISLISIFLGVPVGLVLGYIGGTFDTIFSRFIDILLSFPSLLLALALISSLGPGLTNAVLAVSISYIGVLARLVRGQTLQTKALTYVEAERMMGASYFRIMFLHILPNITGPLLVQITFNMADSIISIAGLSFLGLGAQPPIPDWGVMVYEGRLYLREFPHVAIIPGLWILIAALSLNVLGETLRDCLDPRIRTLLR
jgi:peptide/nickel transport system permease protein